MPRKYLRKCTKKNINAIVMIPKVVIYRKRQGIGLPYIINMKIFIYNQIIKERTSIMTRTEEDTFH